MGLTLVTAPADEPVDIEELQYQAAGFETADDAMHLSGWITAARELVEEELGRQLISATWEYSLEAFAGEIKLPRPPLQSVTSVKYIDTDGNEQTVASSVYWVDTSSFRGSVVLRPGQSWPTTATRRDAVRIRFVAGYGASASAVPARFKTAIRLLAAYYAEERTAGREGLIREIPMGVAALLAPDRVLEAI